MRQAEQADDRLEPPYPGPGQAGPALGAAAAEATSRREDAEGPPSVGHPRSERLHREQS